MQSVYNVAVAPIYEILQAWIFISSNRTWTGHTIISIIIVTIIVIIATIITLHAFSSAPNSFITWWLIGANAEEQIRNFWWNHNLCFWIGLIFQSLNNLILPSVCFLKYYPFTLSFKYLIMPELLHLISQFFTQHQFWFFFSLRNYLTALFSGIFRCKISVTRMLPSQPVEWFFAWDIESMLLTRSVDILMQYIGDKNTVRSDFTWECYLSLR